MLPHINRIIDASGIPRRPVRAVVDAGVSSEGGVLKVARSCCDRAIRIRSNVLRYARTCTG